MASIAASPTDELEDGVLFDRVALAHELARRGATWTDLTKGERDRRIGINTAGLIRRGRPVRHDTALKVKRWLDDHAVDSTLDAVLSQPGSAA